VSLKPFGPQIQGNPKSSADSTERGKNADEPAVGRSRRISVFAERGNRVRLFGPDGGVVGGAVACTGGGCFPAAASNKGGDDVMSKGKKAKNKDNGEAQGKKGA